MELKNIKANFLGDSITEGVGVSSPDKVFHALIKEKYGLVVKPCRGEQKIYRDVLIYRSGYKLSELDNAFIAKVVEARKKHIEAK